jgi:hypothetical protein
MGSETPTAFIYITFAIKKKIKNKNACFSDIPISNVLKKIMATHEGIIP